jgi:hypothetical protein
MFKLNRKLNLSALALLEKHERMLVDECLTHARQLGAISQKLMENWERTIAEEADFIISVARGREALRKTILDLKKGQERSVQVTMAFRYQISSLFLRDCWEYLKSDPSHNERLHLVTGTITADGTRVLSRIEKVRYEKQGAAYVSADKTDSHQRIVSLSENYGHLLLAVFHSHISRGIAATTPSAIDLSFLQRMAQIGCDCLGGIFSLDGYTRFFMRNKDFAIDLYGSGIKKVEEDATYKIYQVLEVNDRGWKAL